MSIRSNVSGLGSGMIESLARMRRAANKRETCGSDKSVRTWVRDSVRIDSLSQLVVDAPMIVNASSR